MPEKLMLRDRRPVYRPDEKTQEQIDALNEMMEALDRVQEQVIKNQIDSFIALHGEISPEVVQAMKQTADAMNAQTREVFKAGFYLSGMMRLQGMLRNPNISPTVVLRAIDLGFKVNGMIPKSPLIAIQNNSQNTYYEGMLREAKRMEIAQSNGNSNNNRTDKPNGS
jgi:hypothetical protein